jgi:hypothetical protein
MDPDPSRDGTTSRWDRWAAVRQGEDGPTILAVLPWLGVPVLVSAALAQAGHPLPGEVLPVVAFFPLAVAAYVAALRVPARWRVRALALPGWIAVAILLAYAASDAGPGTRRTLLVAATATLACAAPTMLAGRWSRALAPLATAAAVAMVVSQGLDGWLTYLAVADPFGWLAQPVAERIMVSRFILERAPALYPALKVGLAVGLALGFRRDRLAHPTMFVGLVLVVCYVGLSPAMFSAANLLAP